MTEDESYHKGDVRVEDSTRLGSFGPLPLGYLDLGFHSNHCFDITRQLL